MGYDGKIYIRRMFTVDMSHKETPFATYIADKREIYVFAALAGGWLKSRQPPPVRETYNFLKQCGLLASFDLYSATIKRLVGIKWLAPRPYGEKLSRYVPTLKGFAGFAISVDIRSRDEADPPSLNCLSNYVDVLTTLKLGNLLVALLGIMPLLTLYKAPMIGLSPEIQAKLVEVMQATIDGRPIDVVPQALELWQLAPVLTCNFAFYLYYFATWYTVSMVGEHEDQLDDTIRPALETMYKLARYCANRKGISDFNKVVEDIEEELGNSTPHINSGTINSQREPTATL